MKKIFFIIISLALTLSAGAVNKYQLENNAVSASVNLDNGSLVGLKSKLTDWEILRDESAGCSFEANIKLADGRFFVTNAFAQVKPEVTISDNKLVFFWNNIKAGDVNLELDFRGAIEMTPDGLVFGGTIDNDSDAVIEQFSYFPGRNHSSGRNGKNAFPVYDLYKLRNRLALSERKRQRLEQSSRTRIYSDP